MPTSAPIAQPGARFAYTYSADHPPIGSVAPGQTVAIETVDAFENQLTEPGHRYSALRGFPFVNPQTGPLIIEGAEPGDTLVAEILAMEITRDFAVTALIPGSGLLTGTARTATLDPPLAEETRILPIRDGHLVFNDRIALPVTPFVGTLGTAPPMEAITALSPGPHGGNLDCQDTCPGNEIHLPVHSPGAHFFIGDAHACQGDGEITGVAAEVPARITLRFRLLKNLPPLAWPRIVSPSHLMVAGSARPLEDAARIAHRELVRWIARDHHLSEAEAYHLLGLAGQMRVGNLVNPLYTVVAKIARSHLH
ncbi:acetamidase/formamidase family protein [soil metagenome]